MPKLNVLWLSYLSAIEFSKASVFVFALVITNV